MALCGPTPTTWTRPLGTQVAFVLQLPTKAAHVLDGHGGRGSRAAVFPSVDLGGWHDQFRQK